MKRENIAAVALQEVCVPVDNLMSLEAGYSLHLGPCGKGPKGHPMRGCGWITNDEWARAVSLEPGSSTVHTSSISISTKTGKLELVSVLSTR